MSCSEEETEFQWTPRNEVKLLYSLYPYRPVGPGRHFVIIAVWEDFKKSVGVDITLNAVKKKLYSYYNFDHATYLQRKRYEFPVVEFSLPLDEFPELKDKPLPKDSNTDISM